MACSRSLASLLSKSKNPVSKIFPLIKLLLNSFHFEYDGRWFEMMTKLKEEADLWVACLAFLSA